MMNSQRQVTQMTTRTISSNRSSTTTNGVTHNHTGSHGHQHHPDRTKGRTAATAATSKSKHNTGLSIIVVATVLTSLMSWFWYLSELIDDDLMLRSKRSNNKLHDAWMASSRMKTTILTNPFCQFRRYPLHRYYKLSKYEESPPEFLASTEVEYIYGLWPTILEQDQHFLPQQDVRKLCVNQTEWLGQLPSSPAKLSTTTWPFADGTNPSVLLMSRIEQQAPHVAHMILQHYPTAYYVVTVCMTNSQCTWNDMESDPELHDLPDRNQKQPNTVRTVLQVLDFHFQNIMETTIYLERDASWGKKIKGIDDPASSEYTYLPALDDARLFVYDSKLFVSYREGPGFGYDVQVLNPIHISIETEMVATHNHTRVTIFHTVAAVIKASESSSFCCGRNMALMPDYYLYNPANPKLHALTWVDPVTVEEVDTTPIHQRQPQKHRRLLLDATNDTYNQFHQPENYRRLKEVTHKSHIHGTNAFMVPITTTGTSHQPSSEPMVFLGIAHFHRPNDRKPNEYARFGHHYTHAFYTISANSNEDGLASFHLTGLSPEFVIRSIHVPDDAEIIQFISGLEYDPSTNQIILSYGINDCEGAMRRMDYSMVQKLLRPIAQGKQVVDFMLPLKKR